MTTSLTGRFKILDSWSYASTDDVGITVTDSNDYLFTDDLADGTGSSQANFIWRDRRTVTLATTTDDIDLSALTDGFGNAISVTSIKSMTIVNLATTAGEDILIGGATSGALSSLLAGSQTGQETIKASGAKKWYAPLDGYAVIPGSEDTLRITHDGSDGDIQFDIIISGTY